MNIALVHIKWCHLDNDLRNMAIGMLLIRTTKFYRDIQQQNRGGRICIKFSWISAKERNVHFVIYTYNLEKENVSNSKRVLRNKLPKVGQNKSKVIS